MKKILMIVLILTMSLGLNATVFKINITIPSVELTGDLEVTGLKCSFHDMYTRTSVLFNGKHYQGIADMLAISASMDTAAERAAVLKYFKKMVAELVNDAMNTSYTWDQIPNSLFTRAE